MMTSAVEDGRSQRWLMRAKLAPPRHDVHIVERGGLLGRLDGILGKRLGLVLAPAGFGKSSLLAQWREHQTGRGALVGWLSLDEADAEPLQFISYLILALSEGGVDLGWLMALAEHGLVESTMRPAISGILEAVAKLASPVVLILDDYHRASAPAVDGVLGSIIGAAPRNFAIALSSRVRPRLDLPRLLAAGVAVEIDADQLRISREDIEKIIDRPMRGAALDLLHAKTEGWPVAIQLAKYLLRSDDDGLEILEGFGGGGHIAAYLTEQVLSSLNVEQKSFLSKTSMLERFDASLADAVTGRSDGRDTLAGLEHLNALLVPLGEPRGWYRYHHLFAEYLQDQLHRQSPGGVRRLHLDASCWFEQHDDLAEAARHAREAGDYARCAGLVEKAGGWELILFEGIGYLRNLLGNIPGSEILDFPRSQVAQAYLHLKDGRLPEARSLYEKAREAGQQASPSPKLARDLLNVGALLDGYEDRRCPSNLDQLGAAIANQAQSDPLTIGVLTCEQSLAALALGRLAEAEARAQEAMRFMRRARTVLGLTYSLLHAGAAALYQGRFQVAEAHLGASYRLAVDNHDSDPGLKAQANVLLASLSHWRGQLTDAGKVAFLTDMERIEASDGWFELYANGLEVECAHYGSPEPAIARARRVASERGLRRIDLLADAHSLRYGSGNGDHAVAHRLLSALPDGVWRREPFLWRPYVESRLALAQHLLDRDRVSAVQTLGGVLDCCRSTGAVIYLVDALVVRALVLDRSGNRAEALADLIEALTIAAPERVARPFERSREIIPLLRALVKASTKEYVDVLVIGFAKGLLTRHTTRLSRVAGMATRTHFSAREQEVLEELSSGRSNKEIARALGLTENTVKSHLKNVFVKLDVESRAQAIAQLADATATDPPAGEWASSEASQSGFGGRGRAAPSKERIT